MQGAILLIAAKRSDQISSELAQHDFDADTRSKEILEQLAVDFQVMSAQHAQIYAKIVEVSQDLP